MDEELNYATLHFKSPNIYIRKRNEKPNSRCQLVRMMGLCLGILCFLLVIANIALSVYFRAVIAEINTKLSDYSNITSENYLLNVEMINLERQKQELSKDRDRLNWTLEVILQFDNFPVHDYCPEKQGNAKERECKPCRDNWIVFQSSCYQFMNGWRSWSWSQDDCKSKNADLIVIESQDEQEFISNYTKFYYDVYHGYWIGLSKTEMPNQRWMWVDGSKLTTRYWTPRPIGSGGDCVLAMPRSLGFPNIMTNWNTASCQMQNRWICKTKALIK
ncbi:C-type lectin domain family 12 member B isoform X2 [Hypomesus transpacificus]|uniref:C-type lectin domain family 12 member B isoform X2 n=1 Tax=Hypomesus transpacificus TaxID=137520 RepID=UPI001F075094|nr:C-type lectin domain family 12 member B isoform X2 [Hypomesus transpacificus]